ncbi:hypothetical protein D3C87_1770190 [compost metagenome]
MGAVGRKRRFVVEFAIDDEVDAGVEQVALGRRSDFQMPCMGNGRQDRQARPHRLQVFAVGHRKEHDVADHRESS